MLSELKTVHGGIKKKTTKGPHNPSADRSNSDASQVSCQVPKAGTSLLNTFGGRLYSKMPEKTSGSFRGRYWQWSSGCLFVQNMRDTCLMHLWVAWCGVWGDASLVTKLDKALQTSTSRGNSPPEVSVGWVIRSYASAKPASPALTRGEQVNPFYSLWW